MVEIKIPGWPVLQIFHLVFDVNGTIAVDGNLLEGIVQGIQDLQKLYQIHFITADTNKKQDQIDELLKFKAHRLASESEARQKQEFVHSLGVQNVIAVGQGANDALMLQDAALGICILSKEGTSIESMLHSDILVPDIYCAFDLLENPKRMIATLRK
jgi:P-type E1-E2 ATPase